MQLAKQKQKQKRRSDEMTTPFQQAMFTKWLLNGRIPATSRKIPFHSLTLPPLSIKDHKTNDEASQKVPSSNSLTLPPFYQKDHKTSKANGETKDSTVKISELVKDKDVAMTVCFFLNLFEFSKK